MRHAFVTVILLGMAFGATPVFAQERGNVGLGYSLFVPRGEGQSGIAPVGWNVSVAGNDNDGLQMIFDIGGHRQNRDGDSLNLTAFQVGIRLHTHRGPWTPFFQTSGGLGFGRDQGAIVLQAGAGVDLALGTGRPSLRAQIDGPIYFFDSRIYGARVVVGLVFQLR